MARALVPAALLLLTSACASGPPQLTPLAACPATVADSIAAADTTVYTETDVTRPPQFASVPVLDYPMELYQHGISGRVVVEVFINAHGRAEPKSVKVLMSTNSVLEPPAVAYVLAASYCPGTISDRAVRVRFIIPIAFDASAPRR